MKLATISDNGKIKAGMIVGEEFSAVMRAKMQIQLF
ncbi:MAG: hypothetical protein CM15mP117_07990 [Alphaproteobacteria bacterium]|nr:MAG: hypothetical protein CM15mP117_07990 [Alphaproteobacteria bacterium]